MSNTVLKNSHIKGLEDDPIRRFRFVSGGSDTDTFVSDKILMFNELHINYDWMYLIKGGTVA